jgi:hypothetical protein
MGLASLDQIKLNLRLPDRLVQNNYVEDNRKPDNEYSFNLTYQSKDERIKKLPSIQNDQYNQCSLYRRLLTEPDYLQLYHCILLHML